LHASLSYSEKPSEEKIRNSVSDLLSNNGFAEIMSLSLTKEVYSESVEGLNKEQNVKMLNPLSSDQDVMRQTMLFSGLEAIAYNVNRKSADLKLYEFGKTYLKLSKEDGAKYIETKHLSLFITGRKHTESWNNKNDEVSIYTLKGIVNGIFEKLGLEVKSGDANSKIFNGGLSLSSNKRTIAEFGQVSKALLKIGDVKQAVYYADIYWDVVMDLLKKKKTLMYTEVPKFPEVRRDLALLIDSSVKFEQLEQLAYQAEKNLLRSVNLFDVYEGDKLPAGKKSYALSFILQDEQATLTDKQIEKIMEKLMKTYQEKAGAEIR
jgi:phenylalanyl-tRNA synthetase beta chain